MNATLHYYFDPLCGWCHAAAPLIDAAAALPGLALAMHGGGLMSGASARRIDAGWREYVMPHDARIAQMTGQPFGEAYYDGLLRDIGAPLDSTPPIAAILAAQALGADGLDVLLRLQRAHFVEGRRIAEVPVLIELAADLGLPEDAFAEALQKEMAGPVQTHIAQSRQAMAIDRVQGFPSLVLAHADGHRQRLEPGAFLGRPEAFAAHLRDALA